MKTALSLALLCLIASHTAHAQLRKCVAPDGKITFSDVMCPGNAKTAQVISDRPTPPAYQPPSRYGRPNDLDYTPQDQDRPAGPTQAQIYERQITGKIAGYLAANDIPSAAGLAVTQEHHAMIAEARQSMDRTARQNDANKRANEAAKRAAQPYECKSTTTRTPWDYNNRSSTTTRCGTVDD